MTIYWNYNKGYVDILIPDYLEKALDWLNHDNPKIPQYAPHVCTIPAYGKRLHMALDSDKSDILENKITNRTQYIVDEFLYYAMSVDTTM